MEENEKSVERRESGKTRVLVSVSSKVAWWKAWKAWKGKRRKGGTEWEPKSLEESQLAAHEFRITDNSGWRRRLGTPYSPVGSRPFSVHCSDFTGSSADAVQCPP